MWQSIFGEQKGQCSALGIQRESWRGRDVSKIKITITIKTKSVSRIMTMTMTRTRKRVPKSGKVIALAKRYERRSHAGRRGRRVFRLRGK